MMNEHRSVRTFFLALCLLMLVLSGCRSEEGLGENDMTMLLRAPTVSDLPLAGVWSITKIEDATDSAPQTASRYQVGDKLYIDPSFVAIGDSVTVAPTFSSKYISVSEYKDLRFITKSIGLPEDQSAYVAMIRDNDLFSLDLIQVDKNTVLFSFESRLYTLTHENGLVPEPIKKEYLAFAQTEDSEKQFTVEKSKIVSVIGTRTQIHAENGVRYSEYASYLIADFPDMKRPEVYRMNHLFLLNDDRMPWILDYTPTEADENNQVMQGTYSYYALQDVDQKQTKYLYDTLGRQITFARGNIISFEKPSTYPPNDSTIRKYELHRLDELDADHSLSVLDIGGKTEEEAFREQVSAQLAFLDPNKEVDPAQFPVDDTNLGILRQNSGWTFVTSMNWSSGSVSLPSRINLDLVSQLKIFDAPSDAISWTRIINKVPLATTASASPMSDRIWIKNEDELLYYRSTRTTIENQALLSIQLDANTDIISLQYFYDEQGEQVKKQFKSGEMSQSQVIYTDPLEPSGR